MNAIEQEMRGVVANIGKSLVAHAANPTADLSTLTQLMRQGADLIDAELRTRATVSHITDEQEDALATTT